MVRGAASSVVQRAETRLGRKVFSIGVPMLTRAGGERVLLLREDLRRPLRALREAIAGSFAAEVASGELAGSAAGFATAFAEWAKAGARGDDDSGRRVMTGYLAITGVMMPADAVLRSSRAAVRSVGGCAGVKKSGRGGAVEAPAAAMQPTLIVREMNVVPERDVPSAES